MKRQVRKLVLGRETLRQLEGSSLEGAQGGRFTLDTSRMISCGSCEPTDCVTPPPANLGG